MVRVRLSPDHSQISTPAAERQPTPEVEIDLPSGLPKTLDRPIIPKLASLGTPPEIVLVEIDFELAASVGIRSIGTVLTELDREEVERAGAIFGEAALRRRDFVSLMRRAYGMTVGALERCSITQVVEEKGEGSPESEAVLAAFGRMRELGTTLFAKERSDVAGTPAVPSEWREIVTEIERAVGPLPTVAGQLLLDRFSDAFAFFFHEVTMRADDTMWARIHRALLEAVRATISIPEAGVESISNRLFALDAILERSEPFLSFKAGFHRDIEAVLPMAETQIRTFAELEAARKKPHETATETNELAALTVERTPVSQRRVARSPVRAHTRIIDERGRRLATYPLLDGITTVGRTEDNALRIDDLTVSNRHALIRVVTDSASGTAIVIRDLGSTNGTFVTTEDGPERIREAELQMGDIVSIGGAFSLQIIPPEDYDPDEDEATNQSTSKSFLERFLRR